MLATLLWWLIIQALGLAVLPLAWRLFARLPGRGYPFAKALGLLLVSYGLWLGASLRVLPNDVGGIAAVVAAVAAAAAWLGRAGWRLGADGTRPLLVWLRANRRLVLATEILFLVVFAGWALFRSFNPDIVGTEKPMEFAFMNGVLGSRFFPPQDPWLSGYGISYYYFGYVMLGIIVRLSGVDPAVGFNLGVALWYALVMIGAFGVVHALVGMAAGRGRSKADALDSGQGASGGAPAPVVGDASDGGASHGDGRAIRWGLVGALFVGLLGNLEGLVETGYHRGLLPANIVQWLDIKQLTDSPPTGAWTGDFWWWWRASRVIHDKDLLGNSVEVIDEFPFFSFLLGDLHPHVLALPFVLLACALALTLLANVRARRTALPAAGEATAPPARLERAPLSPPVGGLRPPVGGLRPPVGGLRWWRFAESHVREVAESTGMGAPGVILYAIALGGLAFLNTWDLPIAIALAMSAVGVGAVLGGGSLPTPSGELRRAVGRAIAAGIVLAGLGWLCYLPFHLGFRSQLGGVLPNVLFPTRLVQFGLMFGVLAVISGFFLLALTVGAFGSRSPADRPRTVRRVGRGVLAALPWSLLMPVLALALVVVVLVLTPAGQQLLDEPAVQANLDAGAMQRSPLRAVASLVWQVRAGNPWTYLLLALGIAWAAGLAWALLRGRSAESLPLTGDEAPPGADSGELGHPRPTLAADAIAVLLILLALVLALTPEFVYLRDLFGTRMNTVFKLYYQAWILLALASAYGLSRLAERSTALHLRAPALAVACLLVAGGLWYPLASIPSKADGFAGQPTLDGLAYLRRSNPADVAAIEWLRANVAPDAVVVEASGGSYSGAGRISMATGNPTLLGWDFHEHQWRGEAFGELTAGRVEALDAIYRTASGGDLQALLDQWDVDYVYVGALERSQYGIGDAAIERFDAALLRVYDGDGALIYAR